MRHFYQAYCDLCRRNHWSIYADALIEGLEKCVRNYPKPEYTLDYWKDREPIITPCREEEGIRPLPPEPQAEGMLVDTEDTP